MKLVSHIGKEDLSSFSNFKVVEHSLSSQDISTVVDVYFCVISSVNYRDVKCLLSNGEGNFIFLVGLDEGETAFDLYEFLSKHNDDCRKVTCVNVGYMYPKSNSRGLYAYELDEGAVSDFDTEDNSTSFMDDDELDSAMSLQVPCLYHEKLNIKIQIPPNGIRLGRSKNADYVIPSNFNVSRLHCNVFRIGNDVYVRDLGSVNGTYVDGVVVKSEDMKVPVDSKLSVADEVFIVKY